MLDIFNRPAKPFNVEDYGGLGEDEYIKDEVIYCKKCNTPRLYVYKSFRARCICKCEEEEEERKKELERERKKIVQIAGLQSASLIGERYKNVSFEDTASGHNVTFDNALIRCQRYCAAADEVLERGLGIYIYGNKGTGKTHLTACMANELIIKYYKPVMFTNFAEISKMIRGTFGRANADEADIINKFCAVDFLFIDDLGTERVQTKDGDLWLQEKIFDVLNKRYNLQKPTVFTSNYSLSELISDRGYMDKTVDRIAEMSNAILKIEGDSYRMKARAVDLPF